MASKTPLKDAKNRFTELLNSVNKADKSKFIEYVFEELACNEGNNEYFESDEHDGSDDGFLDDPVAKLNTIAKDIRKRVPLDAILPSEKIDTPKIGDNADCLTNVTVHVDDFLYDDNDVEDLVEEGKLQRNYCKDCGSKNIEPLIFISHSMSRDALYYIFNTRLPVLKKETVLDIGSRLGAVLYGAYVFTDAPRIIGVEMNEDLCRLQNEVVTKYKMQDRVQILHKRIEEAEDVVKSADVILINNAFEFYLPNEKQIEIWQFLKKNIKSKSILITRPHLETTFKNLNTGIVLKEWVKPYGKEDSEDDDQEMCPEEAEHCDIAFYEIL